MGLFSKASPTDANYLGVDIGGSSIKLVELTNNNGRAQLVTYGYYERSLKGDVKLIDQVDQTAELIKKVVEKSRVVTKRAITALPSPAVFTSIISLTDVSRKDLSSPKKITTAVEWEAKKVLPLPLEEMILDWKVLGSEEVLAKPAAGADDKIKSLQVLLTGAAKEVVQKYIDIFKKAGKTAERSGVKIDLPPVFNRKYSKSDSCLFPWKSSFVDPSNGDVFPCCPSSEIGNIKKDPFKNIWNNTEYKNLRRDILKGKAGSKCEKCIFADLNNVNHIEAHIADGAKEPELLSWLSLYKKNKGKLYE